jgi:putative transposase
VEKAQVRKAVSILRHLLLALRAFLRLEVYRLRTGVSWYEAKLAILREAIRAYLANPLYVLYPTA